MRAIRRNAKQSKVRQRTTQRMTHNEITHGLIASYAWFDRLRGDQSRGALHNTLGLKILMTRITRRCFFVIKYDKTYHNALSRSMAVKVNQKRNIEPLYKDISLMLQLKVHYND